MSNKPEEVEVVWEAKTLPDDPDTLLTDTDEEETS